MRTAAILTVLVISTAALADEVVLENGGKLEGKATRVGDEVVLATPHGEIRMKAADVKSITVGRTVFDDYADKLKATSDKDAAAQATLGAWCTEKGLASEARKHLARAIELDPDQPEARKALGFIRYEDRWLTSDEYHRARGFVKVGDEWIPEAEARRRDATRLEREAQRKHEKTIHDAVVQMSSMKRKTRAAGELALQEYAESLGDMKLGEFASRVESYYNAAWRDVKQALVVVEVRATLATLKRPIPTFTTSLGASSTPVTIQLPELSVISVRTTALVPAEIELDEDE